MKTNRSIAALAATLLFTGCFHEIHELGPLNAGEGLLGTSLGWERPDDEGTAIHGLTIAVGGAAAPFSRTYKDAMEAAGELIPVPAGKNDVLVTVNMTDADGFAVSGMPATRADAAVGDVIVSLKNPASSPRQAWFAVAGADIKDREITIVEPKLQRLLSVLTVNLANVPSGTKVVISLGNVARSVNLTAKDASGRWGLPSADSEGDLQIASLTASSGGPLAVESFTLLPTASAFQRSVLIFDITPTSGNKMQCVCDAPRMEGGKAYTLDLDYNALQPYMYLDTCSITAWEEGWTVSGEILNPTE